MRRVVEDWVTVVCEDEVEAGAAVPVRSECVEEEGHRDVSELCERRS